MTMWDDRYDREEYVYGTAPNGFLAEHAALLQGPVLSIAEGEGRNAVHLAALGLDVLGVDSSVVGLAKARRLATSRGVTIRTEVADLVDFVPAGPISSAVSIFAHVSAAIRKRLHAEISDLLPVGGIMLLEAYAKAQIDRDTGGPKDPSLLLSLNEIVDDFLDFEPIVAREVERDVVEGLFHTGPAVVVQFIGRKTG